MVVRRGWAASSLPRLEAAGSLCRQATIREQFANYGYRTRFLSVPGGAALEQAAHVSASGARQACAMLTLDEAHSLRGGPAPAALSVPDLIPAASGQLISAKSGGAFLPVGAAPAAAAPPLPPSSVKLALGAMSWTPSSLKRALGDAGFQSARAQMLRQQATFTEQLFELHKLHRLQLMMCLELQNAEVAAAPAAGAEAPPPAPPPPDNSEAVSARLASHLPLLQQIPARLRRAASRQSALPPLDAALFRVSPLKPGMLLGVCCAWRFVQLRSF